MASDIDMMRVAYRHAASFSDDPDTMNGAVLVLRSGDVHLGANRIPPSVRKHPERLVRPEKYLWLEHAERDAILSACRAGGSTVGSTLYCPWFACPDCARAIIQAGVHEVVGHVSPLSRTPRRWSDLIATASVMLKESGVKTRIVSGFVGETVRFDGETVTF